MISIDTKFNKIEQMHVILHLQGSTSCSFFAADAPIERRAIAVANIEKTFIQDRDNDDMNSAEVVSSVEGMEFNLDAWKGVTPHMSIWREMNVRSSFLPYYHHGGTNYRNRSRYDILLCRML
jgi:hypothetical protein